MRSHVTKLLVAMVILFGSGLHAQTIPATGGITESLRPEILRRDLELINDELGLAPEQRAILTGLFDDYEDQFNAAAVEVRSSLTAAYAGSGFRDPESRRITQELYREELQRLMTEMKERVADLGPGEDETVIKAKYHDEMVALQAILRGSASSRADVAERDAARAELRRQLDGWEARRREMRESFGQGLQAVLLPEQSARWTTLERRMQRSRWLARGELSGESLDLALVVRDLDLASEHASTLRPVLNAWEAELHDALAARERTLGETRWPLQDAIETNDLDTALALLERQVRARVAIREINDRYGAALVAALPEPQGNRLRVAMQERAFARVYRITPMQLLLDRAAALDGLDPAVGQSLLAFAGAYRRDIAPLNERMVEALRETEPRLPIQNLLATVGQRPSIDDDPRVAVTAERRALDERFLAGLTSLLGPEDLSRIPGYRPAPRARRDRDTIRERVRGLKRGGTGGR